MDTPEFLTVVPQMAQEDPNIYSTVEVYGDVVRSYADYEAPVETGLDPGHPDEILEPNLRVATNLFESRSEDLLNVKIESVDCGNDNVANATDDESMAVEALRQLGNSTYTSNKAAARIETTTPHDLPLLPCSTCDLEFRTTADLNSHAEICRHSQFICPICSDPFDRKIDLNNHLVCHAVERPHACRICSALFIQKADQQKHMMTHGVSIRSQLNQCQVCGQQFQRPSSLTNHMKIHNYQPGRALINSKIEGTSELTDILTGNSDPQMQPVQKITLPSINNITPMNNWNLCYEPENFNHDMNLEVADEEVQIAPNIEDRISKHDNLKVELGETHVILEEQTSNKRKPYACTRCSKTFAREKALISHLNLHRDVLDDYYMCERCDQTFGNSTSLDKHLQFCGVKPKSTETPVEPETPNTTPVQSIQSISLGTVNGVNGIIIQKSAHSANPPPSELLNSSSFDVNVYNKIYKHGCTECGKNFTTKQKLFRHMWIHRKKSYSCELCSKMFDKQELLDAHRLSTHQSGSPYVCPECGKNFSSRQGLWEHNRIHTTDTNSFKCNECPKTFTSRQGYLIHKRKHTDERPYGCRFCWKAFRDGGTLRKHERIHTGERPHACPLCSKAFNQKVVLREHIRWLHTAMLKPNAEGLFECSLCPTKINDKDELCVHLVKHSDTMAQLAKEASKSNVLTQDERVMHRVQKSFPKMELNLKPDTSMEDLDETVVDDPLLNSAETPNGIMNDVTNEIIPQAVEDNIVIHTQLLMQEDIVCDLCGLVFSSKAQLSEHVRVHI